MTGPDTVDGIAPGRRPGRRWWQRAAPQAKRDGAPWIAARTPAPEGSSA